MCYCRYDYDRSTDGEHDRRRQDRLGGGEEKVHMPWPRSASSHDELVSRLSVHLKQQHLRRVRDKHSRRGHQHIGGV